MASFGNWGSLLKQLAIGVLINIGIQALTDKDREIDEGEPKLPDSDPDRPIPLFWGTCRIGLNIFRAHTEKEEIKQDKTFLGIKYGSTLIGYKYRLTGCSIISHGTIASVTDVIINKNKVASRLGPQSFQIEAAPITSIDSFGNIVNARRYVTTTNTGAMSGAAYFLPWDKYPDGALIGLASPNVLGEAGGIGGLLRFYPGDGSHNRPASLEALNAIEDPTYEEPAYPEWAYLLFENYYLGNSPSLPSVELIVSRPGVVLNTDDMRFMPWEANPFYEQAVVPFVPNSGILNGDANPAGILYEMLANRKTGMGIPRVFIYDQDFVDAWNALQDEKFGLSHMIDSIRAGEDDINDILRHIDGVLYWDLQMGKYRLRLLRPWNGDPASLPVLNSANLTSLEYAETALNENVNEIKVEFTNVYRDLLKDNVRAQNLAAIQQAQRVNPATVAYMSVTRPALALQLAQRDLRVRSTVIGRGSFVGDRSLIQFTPGQLVRVTWPEKGLFDKVCRIGEIDYGTLVEGKITGSFVEDYWSLEAPSYETNAPAPPTTPESAYVVPTVEVDVALDTLDSITYNLLITDPSNVVTAVEYSEQVGDGAQTPWVADTDGVYTYEMLKNPVYSTRAFWRVTYTGQDGTDQYIVGEFPQPVVGTTGLQPPVLAYTYSGTDVIITATIGVGANAVRFASAIDSQPSQGDVAAGTLDSSSPYAYTTTAPVGNEMLYVGALATDGTISSAVARIQIPAKVVSGSDEIIVANTTTAPKRKLMPSASGALTWDTSVANEMTPVLDFTLDPTLSGGGGRYTAEFFECPSGIEQVLTVVPAGLTEPSTKLRRRFNLTGGKTARIVGTITETDAPADCELRLAYLPITSGGSPVDIPTGLALDVAGEKASDPFTLDEAMASDVRMFVKTTGGNGTCNVYMASLKMEVEIAVAPVIVPPPDIAGWSDPFDVPGQAASPWIPFTNPGEDFRTVNWSGADASDGAGTYTISFSPNGIATMRGYYRPDVPSDAVWTIEQDADMTSATGGANALGLILYEVSSGKFLRFAILDAASLVVQTQAGTTLGSAVAVGDWGTTQYRIRRNNDNLEFYYNRGSGWTLYGSFLIATYFNDALGPTTHRYGFWNQNWTGYTTSIHSAWLRTE